MVINVIGKRHCSGTSKKSGKPYDFSEVYFIGTDAHVEGKTVHAVTVYPSVMPYPEIVVGADYNVEFGPLGRLLSFKLK